MIETILVVMVLGTLAVTGYLLPVLIGAARRVPDLGSVAVVNILLGWTLAGWVIALAMALRSARPAVPGVHIVQHLPPGGWASVEPPRPPWQAPPMLLPPARPGEPGQPDWPWESDWPGEEGWPGGPGWPQGGDWR